MRPHDGRSARVGFLPADAAADTAAMASLAGLVNGVFAATEDGIWTYTVGRTSPGELADLARSGELAVAERDGDAVGCVLVRRVDEETAELGMLATAPARQGTGVGRALVRFAETASREAGREVMRLRILGPRDGPFPSKDFLAAWYVRMGYRLVGRSEFLPDGDRRLARPCEFLHYRKSLLG